MKDERTLKDWVLLLKLDGTNLCPCVTNKVLGKLKTPKNLTNSFKDRSKDLVLFNVELIQKNSDVLP